MGVEAVLVLRAAFLYFGVRGLTEANVEMAVAHGQALLRLEDALAMNFEATAQGWVVSNRSLTTVANWIYIWGHWPIIIATLVWLHRARRDQYRLLRNAMYLSGAIGLAVFVLYPVAPPRLLGGGEFVDTVTAYSTSYRVLQPPALVNKYAALPSLHVGWNLLVGILIWRNARRLPVRILGVGSPLLMVAAVIATANHYTIDALAGAVVAVTGLGLAAVLRPTPKTSTTADNDNVIAWRPAERNLIAADSDHPAA